MGNGARPSDIDHNPASKARFDQYVPEARGRILQVPIYMPYLEPVTDDYIVQKAQEDEKLQVLFVGGASRRKGLPQVLEAFRMIEKPVRDRLKLKGRLQFSGWTGAGNRESS